jgi:hypothetical protein
MLFANQRRIALSVPAEDSTGKSFTIKSLINYLCQNNMQDTRKELFVLEDHMYVTKSLNHLPDYTHRGRPTRSGLMRLHAGLTACSDFGEASRVRHRVTGIRLMIWQWQSTGHPCPHQRC